MFRLPFLCLPVLILATAASAQTTQSYDFYICGTITQSDHGESSPEALSGLFRWGEDGNWHLIGPADPTVSAFAVDPTDRDLIYLTALNGLWRSSDGGSSWRISNDWTMTEGRAVAVDPRTPNTVYLALPDGIAVSTDHALTLERREHGLPERGKYTETIQVDRMTAGRVLAGTASGIYLTEDQGHLWSRVLSTERTVNDVQQSPHDPDIWMAVTDSAGAWISHDRGVTWTSIESLPDDEALYSLAFDLTHPDQIVVGSWSYGVWTSKNGGATWDQRNDGLPEPHRVTQVGVNPNTGRLYASVFQDTFYQSDDFGQTWTPGGLKGSKVNNFVIVPGLVH